MTTSSRRPLQLGALVAVSAVSLTLASSPALATWRATGTGTGTASTDDMQAGKTPSGTATNQSIGLSWLASTTKAGSTVTGYRIARYTAATAGTATAATGACSGVVAALACTEPNVPVGTWYYSVTPVLDSWTGAESARSAGVASSAPDTTAPVVTLTSPANGSSTNNTKPTFSGAAGTAAGDSPTVAVAIYSGSTASGTAVQTLTATASGATWSVTPTTALADGTYTASASQRDAAGNTGTSTASTFTVKTVAPAVTITSPANGGTTSSSKPIYAGGSPTSGSVSVKVYAGTAATGTALETLSAPASTGGWSVPGTTTLADGTYTVQASSTDAAGNTGAATSTFTVQTTVAPTVSLTSPSIGSLTNSASFSGAASGVSSVTVKVYAGNVTPTATTTAVQTLTGTVTGGTWSASATGLADGMYTVQATASNSAGNATSTAVPFTLDTVGPAVTSVTTGNGGTAKTADAGDTVKVVFSEQLDAKKICSTWTNTGAQTLTGVTATLSQGGQNDTIDRVSITTSCGGALNFGTVSTGGDYLSGTAVNFTASTLVWDPATRTLSLTLGGTPGGNNLATGVTPNKATTYTEPLTGLTDLAGNYPAGDTATTHAYVYTSPNGATNPGF